MSRTARTILLLDRGYSPLMFINRRKAIKLTFKEKAEFLMDEQIVRLLIKITHHSGQFGLAKKRRGEHGVKHAIFLRDNNTCQYCSKPLARKELTLDHIIPRSRGGVTSFLNCVAACKKCNQLKGDKLSHEVGLTLIRPPHVPTKMELLQAMDKTNVWGRFLTWLNNGSYVVAA